MGDTGPSSARLMRGIVSALEQAASGPPNGDALVGEALEGLFSLQGGIAGGDVPSDEELRVFRERVGTLLKNGRNPVQLARYEVQVMRHAERGDFDGYEPACWGRSALQVLREDFADFSLFDDLADETLDEIDEELEKTAEDAPPIRNVPLWVPESHWWWWAPKRTDMNEEERMRRLYGGELDDY